MVVVGVTLTAVAFLSSIATGRLSSMREARYLREKQEKLIVKLQCANNSDGLTAKRYMQKKSAIRGELESS